MMNRYDYFSCFLFLVKLIAFLTLNIFYLFQIQQLKQKHQAEISKRGRDYDETLLVLMQQLPPCGIKESTDHKVCFCF